MNVVRLAFATGIVFLGAGLLLPARTLGFGTIGGSLGLDQRDLRVFDNFGDASANDNPGGDPSFPGAGGAELAIWKAAVEWSSELHGDGQGDPHQPGGLGSGGANFDFAWQGNASSTGSFNDNVHSEVGGSASGVLAYCESPIGDGWRIRYYAEWIFDDGPNPPPLGQWDLQGVATHELGHALGLGHSGVVGATMYSTAGGTGVAQRSIEADDVAGLQSIYGPKSPAKPRIAQAAVDAGAGTVTLSGTGFAAAGNEVWFTNGSLTAPAADPIVRVGGVASSAGGTSLTVAIPPAAGPGDVLVRVPGSGHAALSNPWPFDPAAAGSIFGPPVVTGIAPAAVPSVAVGPNTITLAGTGFSTLVEARINGIALDPLAVAVASDTKLELDVPLLDALGSAEIVLESSFGISAPAVFTVVAPHPPALALESPFLYSASGLHATLGAEPGSAWVLAASTMYSPSVLAGVLSADIGGQFKSLFLLASGSMPQKGWTTFSMPLAPMPFGTPLYLQAATIPEGGSLPCVMSTVASGAFYY